MNKKEDFMSQVKKNTGQLMHHGKSGCLVMKAKPNCDKKD